MGLSNDLISQFVKATKDDKKSSNETIVYGTVKYDGRLYVKLDGANEGRLTPISSTADVKDGDRVTVMIKNHTATVTGSTSDSARSARVGDIQDAVDKIAKYDLIVAGKASVEDLNAAKARIDTLEADNVTINNKITANSADISDLKTDNVKINDTLTANSADISDLKTDNAIINDTLTANSTDISDLKTDKLSAGIAAATYATIGSLDALSANITSLEGTFSSFKVSTNDRLSANESDIESLLKLIQDLNNRLTNLENKHLEYDSETGNLYITQDV